MFSGKCPLSLNEKRVPMEYFAGQAVFAALFLFGLPFADSAALMRAEYPTG
jgi:hypothetical protein